MTSFFAEKQTRTTEDEGRRTEYQLGAGEVLDEFAKLPDEDGELSLKLMDMAPSVELNLVSVCLLPLRIVRKIIGDKVERSFELRVFRVVFPRRYARSFWFGG